MYYEFNIYAKNVMIHFLFINHNQISKEMNFMSFMNQDRDWIYEEMEGPQKTTMGGSIASRITASILLLSVGFASGSIYSAFHQKDMTKSLVTEMGSKTSESSILTTASTNSAIVNTLTNHSISSIVNNCADAVVEITIETTSSYYSYQYTAEGNGSGVIISQDGYILTNNHVIEDANKITVRLRNGKEYEAKLIGKDSKTDTAVIKIEEKGLKYAILGNSSNLQVGDLAVVIGNPLGKLGGTVTSGIISALEREITIEGKKMNLIQTDAGVNPGNSGGGLFNSNGELVGIVTAKSSGIDVENLGFAIPVNDIKSVVDDLVERGYASNRAFLGVGLKDTTYSMGNNRDPFGGYYGDLFSMFYNQMQYGASVSSVIEGSPADKGGIKEGDIIVSVDGNVVSTASEVTAAIANCEVGDEIEIGIIRENKTKTIHVKLAEYKGE